MDRINTVRGAHWPGFSHWRNVSMSTVGHERKDSRSWRIPSDTGVQDINHEGRRGCRHVSRVVVARTVRPYANQGWQPSWPI